MNELVSALRADLALQRDLRDPEIFAVLFAEDHEVIPARFQASFAKVLKLQQACANESREFSLDLITHSIVAPTAVLDFTPEQQVRKRHSSRPQSTTTTSDDDDDDNEEEGKVHSVRPPICSFQVVMSTLLSVLLLLWLTSTTTTTAVADLPDLPDLPPSFQVLGTRGVNLCHLPVPVREHKATQEITIGDLHGNAMKLVYFLVSEGVLRGLTDQEFSRMCAIYHSTISTSTREFYDLLHHRGGKIASNHPTIRLLGDEFADRGTNDELTVMVLEKLLSEGDPSKVQVLLSNHGYEFYSYDQDDHMARLQFKLLSGEKQHASFSNSLHTFHRTVKDKSRAKRVLAMLYKHSLKLVSYSVRDGGMLIFTHAPIGLETLQLFARDFSLNTTCGNYSITQSDLKTCIDLIQHKFDSEIKHRLSWGLRQSRSIMEFMWRRNSDRGKATRPSLNKTVAWVHGHDGFEVAPRPYGYCMDDEFGKYVGDDSAGAQTYSVLVTL
ncbi:hypothetical protein BASA81_004726 [Batrachochytrium salamandrivorans]|nr:hypothetical protein BASA81_004726 [Batrachochytrium salamandrivorans]